MADATMTSTATITKDFTDILRAVDPKTLKRSMRGAMTREANRVRKVAANEMTGIGTVMPLGKSVYARVYPDQYGAGFMVSDFPHKKKGFHTTRNKKPGSKEHQQKPVAFWMEDGTRNRRVGKRKRGYNYVSSTTGTKQRAYLRSGHSTGRIQPRHFLARAEASVGDSVETNLFNDFQKKVENRVRKFGLI